MKEGGVDKQEALQLAGEAEAKHERVLMQGRAIPVAQQHDEVLQLAAKTKPLAASLREMVGEVERIPAIRAGEYQEGFDAGFGQVSKKFDELQARLERAEAERDAFDDAINWVRGAYSEDVFPPESSSVDAQSAKWARMVCDNIRARADEIHTERQDSAALPDTGKKKSNGDKSA